MEESTDDKGPLKDPNKNKLHSTGNFRALDESRLFKGMKLMTRERTEGKKPKLVEANQVATAAETQLSGPQGQVVEPKKKITLINFIQDPLTDSDKNMLEGAVRRNKYVRISLKIREQAAWKKQKLIVDLPDEVKEDLTQEEIKTRVEALKKKPLVQQLLRKFRTRDKNVKMPIKLKTLGKQCLIFGRNLLIVTFQNEESNEVKNLMTINSRRMGDPILDEENDMSFEGCFVDTEPLIKDSMIYATYDESEYSPHTAHFGYPPLETCVHDAETHNIITEEDFKEMAKSGWLPTTLLPVDTSDLGESQKATRIQNIVDNVNPGKVLGYSSEHIPEGLQVINMQPTSNWLETLTDSIEMKILNAFHVPLFLGKTDKIANRDTALTSAQLFIDGIVTDDQEWMENLLLEQWYEPLLREELKKAKTLTQDTEDSSEADESVDLEDPEGDDAPLPFVIKRKFGKMTVQQLTDLAATVVSLVDKNVWDIPKANEVLDTEEVTPRVLKIIEEKKKEQEKIMKAGGGPPVPGQKPQNQDKPKPSVAVANLESNVKIEFFRELIRKLRNEPRT